MTSSAKGLIGPQRLQYATLNSLEDKLENVRFEEVFMTNKCVWRAAGGCRLVLQGKGLMQDGSKRKQCHKLHSTKCFWDRLR